MKTALTLLCFLALLTVTGCSSSKSPVLYPNPHLQKVGPEVAQADIDDCMRKAYASGADAGKAKKVAKETATGAAVGAGSGAAVGAVSKRRSAGRGAAMGAAGGATAKLVSGSIRARDPSPIFMRYVDQCLRDQGYRTLGWR